LKKKKGKKYIKKKSVGFLKKSVGFLKNRHLLKGDGFSKKPTPFKR
jgi:hypothetical protein